MKALQANVGALMSDDAVVGAVTGVSPPVNTVAPVASGSLTVGSTLSVTNGTWTNSPTGYTYQWQRGGVNISGATASTYVTVTADGGTNVSCNVTASNAGGSATQASNALAIAAGVWTPAQLPGLVAWYDAQNAASITLNGGTVAQWNDVSGNGLNVVQGTATKQPGYNAIGLNGYPAATFDGASSRMSATLPAGRFSAGVSEFIVFNQSGAGGSSIVYLSNSAFSADPAYIYNTPPAHVYFGPVSNTAFSTSGQAPLGVHVPTIWDLNYILANDVEYEWANGTQQHTVPAGTGIAAVYGSTAGFLDLGSRHDDNIYSIPCSVGEIILAAGTVDSDRQKCEGYLAWKWGLQASLPAGHPYKSAPP